MSRAIWIITAIVFLILVAIIATSCSSRNNTRTIPSPTSSVLAAVEVRMENFQFSPNPLNIFSGDSVSFVNYDSVDHTITSDLFSSGIVRSGQVYTRVFSEKGEIDYYDALYPTMRGKIIVE